ncbi:MAG: SusC/RagA family TonB-linked outer membrane protein [Chitinophagaceae bacterium]
MKSACKKIGLFLVCLFLTALTWAQTKRISGKVLSEEDNKPLVGVSVSVKGKSAGTQTDASGEFSIDATNGNILVVTYTGYIPQEVKVDNSTNLSLTMKADASKLGEVVVVGYGTQRRKEFAGSSTTVNPLTTKFTPSSNVGTALQGTVPGLTVQQTTGAPGSTPNIVFRGGTDFDGSGSPLIVLDGVVVPSLYGIVMNDVESVDVLKDAASTAIYGARAANGVVIVTTKKGKKGKTQVQYTIRRTSNYVRSIGDEYLSAADYIRMNRLGIRARYLADSLDGNTANVNADKGQLTGNWGWAFGSNFGNPAAGLYTTQRVSNANRQYVGNSAFKLLVDANPFSPSQTDSILYKEIDAKTREDMIMRATSTVEHGLNFSGANDQGAFALGLNALRDDGTIIGSQLKRLSMNFNGGLNVGKNLKLNLNTSAYTINATAPYNDPGTVGLGVSALTASTGGLLQRFIGVAPTVRYTNDTSGATLPGPNDVTLGNPNYWSQLFVNNNNEQRFSGNLNAEYTILPFLKFIASGSGFLRYGNANNFTKSFIAGNGGSLNTNRPSSFSNYRDIQYTYNGFLQFSKEFNAHRVTVMAGGELTDYKRYVFSGSAQGAPTDLIPWLTADPSPTVINGSLAYSGGASSNFQYWEKIASAISRVNYAYKDKYFLTGVLRLDGSSRLNKNNFYGVFPGISAGWNLQSEDFYKKSNLSNYISTIKPRISYGVNGNLQSFGNSYFPTAQVYSSAGIYNGLGGTYAPSYINPDLRWERTNSLNFGADLGFLNNRINVVADYFIRNVFDKLASLNISAQTGFTGYTTNVSQLQNRGFELSANAKIIRPRSVNSFSLDAGVSFYTVKSYAIKLPFNGLPGNRTGFGGLNPLEVWDPANPGKTKFVRALIEGERIGTDEVWAPKWAGIYTSAAQITKDASVYNSFLPYGNKKLKQMGDAQWYQVYQNDTMDTRQFVFAGRTTPKGSGSFFFNTGFKGIHLYTAFDYAYGFVILNNEKLRGLSQVQGSQNGTKDILDTWTPNNSNAALPMYYWANQGRNYATDASGNNPPANMWEKGDYIMLREMTLSYDFTRDLLSKAFKNKVQGISLFVTGSNLAYFTKYSGTFPEVGGFDNGRYPLPRRLTLGAQVTL